MRKFALTLSLVGLLMPATATAHARSVKQKYTDLYYAVKHVHGSRAPGRNIRRYGVRTSHGTHPATTAELRESIGTLHSMLAPSTRYLAPGAPPIPPSQAATLRAPTGGTLDAIARCESGGNPSTDTGNGFYGKYQFTLSTWQSVGGSGNPAQASEAEQDQRAARLYAQAGPRPWPVCGR